MMEAVNAFSKDFILLAARVVEMFGVVIIIFFSVYVFLDFVRTPIKYQDRYISLTLARRLALGLEFMLGAEILRTVVVRTMEDLLILGAVVALRGALSLIIQWEIKHMEEKPEEEPEEE